MKTTFAKKQTIVKDIVLQDGLFMFCVWL